MDKVSIKLHFPQKGSTKTAQIDRWFFDILRLLGVQIQGVPKVRSSNFTHYNFWSKLYFYMKFLENIYFFSIKYMYSEFQWLACPFCFFFITFCSRCGMKWDTAFGSILSFSITWCEGSSLTPKQNLFSLGSWKKYILGIHPKKIIIPAPFHSKAFVLLYKFKTSWALLQTKQRFFAISGASNFKHFKQLFRTLSFGLLTMWGWASLSSLLFCI